ncbi:hypothetical protein HPC49_01280 [Pyxidicoccus fallax]|uniref:Uncharacterized protein n=1 Tax=Pyxidicoccus fallax TaxID=394095 RepID=A0A848L9E1_9BACT|nr:hypothetical protein [Pyxidicoccus fallax]NMO15187.1 hypothetical protein [Pyxidicoccus fallax]NPC76886.1 hypothetical protein [Pyxidicoccus fallax]
MSHAVHRPTSLLPELLGLGLGEVLHTPSDERFLYPGVPLVELRRARQWTPGSDGMSGVQANIHTIDTYQALDVHMARYLGAPELSTWVTFGKYAAREAGSWIRILETMLSLSHLGPGGGTSARRLRLSRALLALASQDGLLSALISVVQGLFGGYRTGAALLADAQRLAGLLPEFRQMGQAARNGLVEGNTEMYHRVGFAFDVFLRAESEGRNGVEALQEIIATGALEDPQGYLQAGFSLYREAHLVGLLSRSPGVSRGRQLVLDSCRRHLVHEGNLLIAVQEQALVLQRPSVFTQPVLHALLGAVRPGQLRMTLTPMPGGRGYDRFTMLPDGGNWADFEARMGVRDVTDAPNRPAYTYCVIFPGTPPSEARHYVVDTNRRGTIVDLFTRYLCGPASEQLLRGRPRELQPL